MKRYADFSQRVEAELAAFHIDRRPRELYTPIEYLVGLGGKRIRPSLLLMACDCFAGEDVEAITPAVGLELFHNFSLMHDDIMDQAPVRRGSPTVHMKWDEPTAILSGDAMLVLAYQKVMTVPSHLFAPIFRLFNETALSVCEGQMMDMRFEQRDDVEVGEYLEMIRLKTAVLLACALGIGAMLGGADEQNVRRMQDLGSSLGLAFQLKDDILDTFGDEGKTGKRVGGDILARKKTYLLLKARAVADTRHQQKLQALFDGNTEPEVLVREVRGLFEVLGVRENAERMMKEYFDNAQKCLEDLPVPEERKAPLAELIEKLFYREQ